MFRNKIRRGSKATSGSLLKWRETGREVPICRVICAAVLGLISILGFEGLPALGSSFNLTDQDPDISAGFINVSYNATAGNLLATGFPISFNLSDNPTPDSASIVGGQYNLTAQVTQTGQPVSGSLDITGTIPGLATSGTLLTGQLSQFGFQSGGGDIFEFIFHVTGGDLAPYYDGKTSIILDAWGSGFNGSFATNFAASPYLSVADDRAVAPEPSTAILLLAHFPLGWRRWHAAVGTSARRGRTEVCRIAHREKALGCRSELVNLSDRQLAIAVLVETATG